MRRIAAAGFLVFLVLLPAFGDEPGVRTDREGARVLPLPVEEGVFHFAIFGDRTGGPREGLDVLRRAVEDTNLLSPDLVMTVGDLVQGYNPREPWLAEMREYRKIMSGLDMPWYPVAGNHDVYWRGSPAPEGEHESDYEEHFGPLWYWFPHKNAAFFVLFSDEDSEKTGRKGYGRPDLNRFSDEQLAWLEKALAEAEDYDHVFLFMHHPRWIERFYSGSNWDKVHAMLKAAGNVTAVFGGHIHRQRYDGIRDGIAYYTLSTTGGGIPFDSPGSGYLHHMNLVTVRPDRIAVATIPVGAVLDPREMTPAHLAGIDKARSLPVTVEGEPVMLGAHGRIVSHVELVVRNPCDSALDITVTPRGSAKFFPDHHHFRLESGAEREFGINITRDADGLDHGFRIPEVVLEVEYLTDSRRISLGEQVRTLLLRPESFPERDGQDSGDQALAGDGRGACIVVPASTFSIPDGPFTVEARVKPAQDGATGVILGNFDCLIYLAGGIPHFGMDIGEGSVEAIGRGHAVTADGWHHVAGVFDGETMRVFIDGELAGEAAATGVQPRSGVDFHVGAQCDTRGRRSAFFAGTIDEVRVSKTARYGPDGFTPALRHEPDEDTVVLLHLDAPHGPFVEDASASGAHGCLRDGAELVPVSKSGGEEQGALLEPLDRLEVVGGKHVGFSAVEARFRVIDRRLRLLVSRMEAAIAADE